MGGAVVQMSGRHRPAEGHGSGSESESWLLRRARVLRVAVSVGALIVLPIAFYGAAFALTRKDLGFDLRHAYLPAARHVLHGLSPYASSGAQSLIDQTAYVYPPLLALVVSPLAVLPSGAAALVGATLFLVAVLALLWLLDVRDWRCYGLALLWAPTFNAIDNVNVSLVLALGLSVAWRHRDRPLVSGVALGLSVALKVFAWPVLLWSFVTGRTRAGVASLAVALGAIVVPWAIVGFDGLSGYPGLVRRLTRLEQNRSYSVHAVVTGLGAPTAVATVVVGLFVAALLVAVVVLGRRGDELRSFTLAIAAAIVASPIVWQHYLVLLLVPLSIARPRLSAAWFLPLVLWACNLRGDNGRFWQTLLVPSVAAVLVVVCLRSSPGRGFIAEQPHPSGTR